MTRPAPAGASNKADLVAGDWQYLVYMMRQDVEFLATNVT